MTRKQWVELVHCVRAHLGMNGMTRRETIEAVLAGGWVAEEEIPEARRKLHKRFKVPAEDLPLFSSLTTK